VLKTDLHRAGHGLLELAREIDRLPRLVVAQRLLEFADRLNRLALAAVAREIERVSG